MALSSRTLTTQEAARKLGVTEQRIRQLAAAGEIKAEKWGRDWMVDTESVERRKKAMEQKKREP